MRTYTVHARPGRAPVLVREGFSLAAALFGPLWLVAHRAWIPAALSLAAGIGFALLPEPDDLLGLLALAWAHGVFGNDLRRWSLAMAGAATLHVVAARDEDAAFARLAHARPDLAEAA